MNKFAEHTILLAEDDRFLVQMYKSKLQMEGFNVLFAADGEEAISLLNTNPEISLAVLDIIMPKADGLQVLTTIRNSKNQDLAGIPVLFVSNVTDDRSISKSLVAGANHYIMKPGSTPSEVVQTAKQLLTLRV